MNANGKKKRKVVVRASTLDGGEIKSVERKSGKRVETFKKKEDGYKSRQVTGKDGYIKKTVTKTPGAKEKETENKNRAVRKEKYRKEGVKTKVVVNKKTGEEKYTFKRKGEKKLRGEEAREEIEGSKAPVSPQDVKFAAATTSMTAKMVARSVLDKLKKKKYKSKDPYSPNKTLAKSKNK